MYFPFAWPLIELLWQVSLRIRALGVGRAGGLPLWWHINHWPLPCSSPMAGKAAPSTLPQACSASVRDFLVQCPSLDSGGLWHPPMSPKSLEMESAASAPVGCSLAALGHTERAPSRACTESQPEGLSAMCAPGSQCGEQEPGSILSWFRLSYTWLGSRCTSLHGSQGRTVSTNKSRNA